MRRSLALALGVGAVVGAAFVMPAAASAAANSPITFTQTTAAGAQSAGDPDTTVTFTVSAGGLSMTAPTGADLGSGLPGSTLAAALGTSTVTDARGLLDGGWTATVGSSDFTTGGGTADETIPAGDAAYDPGTVTTTGTITIVSGAITLANAAAAVVTGSASDGDNSASWDPTETVVTPAQSIAGAYTSTLTESVS